LANGFVKLHRKLLDNEILRNPHLLQLFVYCLLKANWTESEVDWDGKKMILQPGQFITGRFSIARDLNCKPITAYARLRSLKRNNTINTKSNNKKTLVTIVNWELYQSDVIEYNNENNNENNNKITTKYQQNNTNEESKKLRNKEKEYRRTASSPSFRNKTQKPANMLTEDHEHTNIEDDDSLCVDVIAEAKKLAEKQKARTPQ